MPKAVVFGLAAIAALAFLLLHASGRLPFTKPPVAVEKLSIALSATPHAALLYLAVAKGYMADEGLAVTVSPVSHGKAALELLRQGKVDLAAAAEVPFVISVLKGERLSLAATVASVSTEMAVVARRDRAIASPRDLAGKKVGVTFGTSGEYFLWAFLIRNKLAPESVSFVDVPPGQMVQSLARGDIDAVSTWEPIKSKAHAALAGNALSFKEADAYTVTHVLIGHDAFLKSNASAIKKLLRALLKAEAFHRAEPQLALALVAEQLKLNAQALAPGWADITFAVDLRQSQLVTMEDEARWAIARGYAEKTPFPNFLPHLYLEAMLAVQPDRVTVVY